MPTREPAMSESTHKALLGTKEPWPKHSEGQGGIDKHAHSTIVPMLIDGRLPLSVRMALEDLPTMASLGGGQLVVL